MKTSFLKLLIFGEETVEVPYLKECGILCIVLLWNNWSERINPLASGRAEQFGTVQFVLLSISCWNVGERMPCCGSASFRSNQRVNLDPGTRSLRDQPRMPASLEPLNAATGAAPVPSGACEQPCHSSCSHVWQFTREEGQAGDRQLGLCLSCRCPKVQRHLRNSLRSTFS